MYESDKLTGISPSGVKKKRKSEKVKSERERTLHRVEVVVVVVHQKTLH